MPTPIGGSTFKTSFINGEWRIGVLERIVERLSQFAPPDALSQADIERFREEVFADLHAKYPNAGLAKGFVPYGIPVPGKPDLVETPFSPGKYVDVSPFAPGTEVRDPYTGRFSVYRNAKPNQPLESACSPRSADSGSYKRRSASPSSLRSFRRSAPRPASVQNDSMICAAMRFAAAISLVPVLRNDLSRNAVNRWWNESHVPIISAGWGRLCR